MSKGGNFITITAHEPRKKYQRQTYNLPDKASLTLYKNKKIAYKLDLKSVKDSRLFTDIRREPKNPDKISFGKLTHFTDRLEFCTYLTELKVNPATLKPSETPNMEPVLKFYRQVFFLFLNGESFQCDIDDWRKIYRIMNRIGHFLGILGKKKARQRRKK